MTCWADPWCSCVDASERILSFSELRVTLMRVDGFVRRSPSLSTRRATLMQTIQRCQFAKSSRSPDDAAGPGECRDACRFTTGIVRLRLIKGMASENPVAMDPVPLPAMVVRSGFRFGNYRFPSFRAAASPVGEVELRLTSDRCRFLARNRELPSKPEPWQAAARLPVRDHSASIGAQPCDRLRRFRREFVRRDCAGSFGLSVGYASPSAGRERVRRGECCFSVRVGSQTSSCERSFAADMRFEFDERDEAFGSLPRVVPWDVTTNKERECFPI